MTPSNTTLPESVDHLVIGPTGVFVIDSKQWTGSVHQSPDGLVWHNHYRLYRTLAAVRWEALVDGARRDGSSLGAVVVKRDDYIRLLGSALGSGAAGSGAASSASGAGFALREVEPPADFGALDRLLEAAGVAGASGPAGQLIAQLLGQTS